MSVLFIILIFIACIILTLVVLVQNPKGGGLAGNIGGFSNQFMGVKQTTDVLDKVTWYTAGAIALLCIISSVFIPADENAALRNNGAPTQQTAPAPPPAPGQPVTPK